MSKNVQMRLSDETLDKIGNIKKNTGVENRTRIVTSGITILDTICSEIEKGSSIFIEDKKGNKKQMMLIF